MDNMLNLEELQQNRISHEYSVSEISRRLKSVVEDTFNNVRVRGEVSGFKCAPSGHVYFNLKDQTAVIKAVCWKGLANALNFKLEDGLEIIVSGRISIYEGQSTYQIIIQKIELAGLGALLALFEKRKAMLTAEGLFDSARKRPIPFLPKSIGVVTSPTGSVIRDILHRINDRMGLNVLVWPVLVQGPDAPSQIANAINGFNKKLPDGIETPDTLIIARGGGSIEDLWAFNEEIVVRAAAASKIPLISAIGHETDTTLIDFAADKRAPTPTAAAEMATPVRLELVKGLSAKEQRLRAALLGSITSKDNKLTNLSLSLINFSQRLVSLDSRIKQATHKLETSLSTFVFQKAAKLEKIAGKLSAQLILRSIKIYESKLTAAINMMASNMLNLLLSRNQKIASLGRLLESFNYKNVLKRGYAIVKSYNNKLIVSKEEAKALASLTLEFKDGKIKATVHGATKAKHNRRAVAQSDLFDYTTKT